METLNIDKTTFTTKNYFKSKTKKQQIVIGNSLRKGDNHIIRLQHKDFGKTMSWPTFTVKKDGTIYQHYNPDYYSDYLEGFNNKPLISIVLENMGWLRKDGNTYLNWINETSDNFVKHKWDKFEYWDGYTKKQMKSLKKLCLGLCNKYDIVKSVINFHYYHKEIRKYKGIVLTSNYIKNTTQLNPIFDLKFLEN